MVGLATRLVFYIWHHADDAPGLGGYAGGELQDRIVPLQMMVERIPIREHPSRQALAYNRDGLAATAVGIGEIASFEGRQTNSRNRRLA